jgi:predicted DNA-binding transcriptional regulator AlpA
MNKKLKEKIIKMISEAIDNASQAATKGTYSNHDLLNDTQSAEILGIAKGTLAVWRHHGKGPKYVKIGSNTRYQYSDLLDYITSQKSPQ